MIIWLPLLYNNHISDCFLRHIHHHHLLVSVEEIRCLWPNGHSKTKIDSTGLFRNHFYDDLCAKWMPRVGYLAQGWHVSSHSCQIKSVSGLTFMWTSNSVISWHFIFSRRWYLKENWMLDAWFHLNVSSMNCNTHPLFKRRHFFPKQSVLTLG